MPPYLHYEDPADEEESCPQPSALPAALAASLPAMHQSQGASHPRFHSHPPLPPHPLLKLHRSAANSPTHANLSPGHAVNSPAQAGSSPGHAANSPGHGHVSPVLLRSTMSRSAGSGPAAKGPGTSNPTGSTQARCFGSSPEALHDVCIPFAPEHPGSEAIQQQQPQRYHPQHAEPQHQSHQLMTAQGAGRDDGRHGLGPVAASHGSGPEAPHAGEQAPSDSGSEGSELSEHESAGAVGDDELLDHDPNFAHCDAAVHGMPCEQTQNTVQSQPDTQLGPASLHHYSHENLSAISACEAPTHLGRVTQHGQGIPGVGPGDFGDQGFSQQHRRAAHPQLRPSQAMGSAHTHMQMHHARSRRGLQEEHVSREDSKLAAAYRRHSHPEQQQTHQEEERQQQLQRGQVQSTGESMESIMTPCHVATVVGCLVLAAPGSLAPSGRVNCHLRYLSGMHVLLHYRLGMHDIIDASMPCKTL